MNESSVGHLFLTFQFEGAGFRLNETMFHGGSVSHSESFPSALSSVSPVGNVA